MASPHSHKASVPSVCSQFRGQNLRRLFSVSCDPNAYESLAAPVPGIKLSVKIEAPAQAKEASAAVPSEVPCFAAGNTTDVDWTTSSEIMPTKRLKAAYGGDGKAEAEHEAEAQSVAEAAIRQLEIN
ncbi:hypothetical protein HU200_022261 [Digitaria exilis]|uniref:Uncharacterized protein n=1 Tax=Digitaria exilis TaxID=1010633 RepID=A0A835KAD1_9POAL|nr:hypothetical protein HU200_022261 [Digitaria exilis]